MCFSESGTLGALIASPEDNTFVQIFQRYSLQLVRNVSTEAVCQKKLKHQNQNLHNHLSVFMKLLVRRGSSAA